VIDAELLEESRGHQYNRVGVEAAGVGLVQAVLRKYFLNYQHDVPKVGILLLELFDLVH
jgi:hypothetical protein